MAEYDNNFERLRTALLLKGEPDRVPLLELGVDTPIKEQFLDRSIQSVKDDVEFWQKAHYDYAWARVVKDADNLYPLFSERQHAEGDDRQWVTGGAGPIQTRDDFEQYPWPDFDKLDFSLVDETKAVLPDGMGIISGEGGFFSFSWMLMGMEKFSLTLYDDPALVEAIIEKVCSINFELNKRTIENPNVDVIWCGDDFAYAQGLMMPPDFFRKFIFPWYKKLGSLCKERGIPFILHSDGNLKPIMSDLIDIGFNAIHPIEPNAMDIFELKKELAGKLCIIGNIDLAGPLVRGTPEEVADEVKRKIKGVAAGGGYCLGSSNSVTNYVPIENYKAMIDATLKYGKYPISL